ncbi:MAG: tetratricopeptide repeat protein [Kofleriaceae bacterium]
MTRSILTLAIAFAVIGPAVLHPEVAHADQTPSKADLEKAKTAFAKGKAAFDKGDFPEAIASFKQSYELSKNPVLLYNIGFANESAKMDDIALYYYRKFLAEAPADAAQRAEVTERVKVLEKKFQVVPSTPSSAERPNDGSANEPKKPIVLKPAGTYGEADFQHQIVDVAPPKKPLDITAFVPEDSGWTVTLFYRTSGEGKFASKEMKWRYKELVGRVPPTKMIGESVQYYLEVKDTTGAVITRAGKSTSPNLVTLEAGATERFYPDFDEEGKVATTEEIREQDEEDDPFAKNKRTKDDDDDDPTRSDDDAIIHTGPRNGFTDVGSTKFTAVKWGTTIGAVALIAGGVVLHLQAGKFASELENESKSCGDMMLCTFDPYNADLEAGGKSRQTWSRVGFAVGAGAAAVAAYFWYKDLTAKKRGEFKVAGKNKNQDETAATWTVVPSVDDQFAGATAAARF